MATLADSLNALADLLEAKLAPHHYEIENVKRFVPDADACAICEDAADLGWIEDDATFEGVFGDEDGPPLHPNCGCTVEYGEKRVRVYD